MNDMKKRLVFGIMALFIAASIVMPSSAIFTNIQEKQIVGPFGGIPTEIKGVKQLKTKVHSFSGDDVLVSSAEGDDIFPSITKDKEWHTVVTWTNEQSYWERKGGIAYADSPDDPDDWESMLIELWAYDDCMYFDTARVVGSDPDDFKGLMGVFMAMEGYAGFYLIEDITEPDFWEFYTWSNSEAPEAKYACIADSGFYQNIYYPSYIWGPFNLYIYRWQNQTSDIPDCPVLVHTGLRYGPYGAFYPDPSTAPATDADMVALSDRIHTVIYSEQYNRFFWKKIVPSENPDIASTPYQMMVTDAADPAIAATEDDLAIVYTSTDGYVKCLYSSDDGDTWDTTTIAAGCYPDIYAFEEYDAFYATYIHDGNLYLVVSDDGGATWGDASQINDVDGTVVEMTNSVDIHEEGVVWVDSRGEDYDIYFHWFWGWPELIDIRIRPGVHVGVVAELQNVGWFDIEYSQWSIELENGFIFHGRKTTGTIPLFRVSQIERIRSKGLFGFGKVKIIVAADPDSSWGSVETAEGFVLGPFVFIDDGGSNLNIPAVYSGSYETFFNLIEEYQQTIWNNILEADENHEGEYTEGDLVWFLLAVLPDDFFNQGNMQNNQNIQQNNNSESSSQQSISPLLKRILTLHPIFTRLLNLQ